MDIQNTTSGRSSVSAGAPAPVTSAGPSPNPTPISPIPVKSRDSGKFVTYLLGLAVLVAVAGLAFAGGRLTAPAGASAQRPGGNGAFTRPTGSFAPDALGVGNAGASLHGTVVSIDTSSMTIKTTNGQSLVVTLSPTTTYHRSASASAAAITPGSTVNVGVTGFGQGSGAGGSPSSAPAISANDVTVVGP
jgi:hypothetical protein